MKKLWLSAFLLTTFLWVNIAFAERKMSAWEYCQQHDLWIPHIVQEGLDSVSNLTPLENELVPLTVYEYDSVKAVVEYIPRAMYDEMLTGKLTHFEAHIVGYGVFTLEKEWIQNRLLAFYVWENGEYREVYRRDDIEPDGISA